MRRASDYFSSTHDRHHGVMEYALAANPSVLSRTDTIRLFNNHLKSEELDRLIGTFVKSKIVLMDTLESSGVATTIYRIGNKACYNVTSTDNTIYHLKLPETAIKNRCHSLPNSKSFTTS
jgi:hypothetical protein